MPAAYVVGGALVLLAGLIVLSVLLRPSPVATPTPVPKAPPTPAGPPPTRAVEPLPFSISFVSGQRAVQVPVGLVRRESTDLGALPELAAAPSGGGLLVALAAPTNDPVRAAPPSGRELVAIYLGLDERVTAVGAPAGAGAAAPAVGPYALVLVAARSTPHLDQIAVGDRAVLGDDLRRITGTVQAPGVPAPPRGTVEPYPGPSGERATPRPTQQPAYPVKG